MTIVTSYDWTSDTWTHNGDNPARKAWREAASEIADSSEGNPAWSAMAGSIALSGIRPGWRC